MVVIGRRGERKWWKREVFKRWDLIGNNKVWIDGMMSEEKVEGGEGKKRVVEREKERIDIRNGEKGKREGKFLREKNEIMSLVGWFIGWKELRSL